MNMKSTNGVLKLFAVELIILIIIWYALTIAVMNGMVSLSAGLVIFVLVLLAEHAVEYYVLDI